MRNKLIVKVDKIYLPLRLEDNFEFVSYNDGVVTLKYRHSNDEVLIECVLEPIVNSRFEVRVDAEEPASFEAVIAFSSLGTNVSPAIFDTDKTFDEEITKLCDDMYTVTGLCTCSVEVDFV